MFISLHYYAKIAQAMFTSCTSLLVMTSLREKVTERFEKLLMSCSTGCLCLYDNWRVITIIM